MAGETLRAPQLQLDSILERFASFLPVGTALAYDDTAAQGLLVEVARTMARDPIVWDSIVQTMRRRFLAKSVTLQISKFGTEREYVACICM